MTIRPSPQQLAEHALATTTAPDCVAIVSESSSANLRWANNTVTTNGVMHAVHVTVVVFRGGATASASGSAATVEQVDALLRAAEAALDRAAPAEDRQPLVEGGAAPDYEVEPGTTSIEQYADLTTALGEEFDRAEREGRILYGFVDHDVTTTYLASSTGLRLRHEQPTGYYECTGKPVDLSRSAWVGGATGDFTDVDAHTIADTLARRLSWGAREVDLPAGRYDTVLPPTAVADLVVDAYWSAGARDAHDGQSVYSRPGGGTRIGESVTRPGVRLWSDPTATGLDASLRTAPFHLASSSSATASVFDNGLALGPTDWIRDGVLTSLIQTRRTAEVTGLPVTPAVDNLALEVADGQGTVEDLVAGVERGLLLTCLWYIREVDPQSLLLTGLTRDGVYLVEGGEITGVVNNFRFNESPISLLERFSAASATQRSFSREWGPDFFSRTATPALRVPDFLMSSTSQAR